MSPPALKLSLTTRIFLGYAVVLVTFGAVSLFSVTELRHSQVEIRLVSEGYLQLSQTVAAIETFQANQAKDTERLRDEQSVETRRALIRLARLYFPGLMAQKLDDGQATAAKLLDFAPDSERPYVLDVVKKFGELKVRFREYEAEADETFTLLEAPAPDWPKAGRQLDRLQQIESGLSSTIRLLHGSLEARIHERVRQAQERERRTGVAIIVLPVVAIVVGLLATGFAARSLRPVRTLIDGVSRIGRGDYEAKLGITGDDEIAVLAREFDAMASALKEREAQLKQKQQELLRAERLAAMGRVSAQVAHEVRNPLSSIGLNVEMIQEQLGSATFATTAAAQESKELLAAVIREIDRVTEITEDYLRLARLPAPVLRREDVVPLLESVVDFAAEELARAKVTVQRAFEPGGLAVSADEGQLRQVLINLVRNAREAMGSGGVLTLAARRRGADVEITVGDTGPGMGPDVQGRLFEPFFTTKAGGTGLGLSLSRQIIEAHGGRIAVESTPGQGARFIITLPAT
jgi:two-component system NtrC family sensor kinase